MTFEKPVIDSHMHLHYFKNQEGIDFYTFFDDIKAKLRQYIENYLPYVQDRDALTHIREKLAEL